MKKKQEQGAKIPLKDVFLIDFDEEDLEEEDLALIS